MYNPENLELPEDLDDPRLKKYTWRYDFVVGQVFASEGNRIVPEMYLDVGKVRSPETSFIIMYGPEDVVHVTEAEQIFEIERLNPSDERFSETSKEVLEILGLEISEGTPSLASWYEEVTRENCGFLAVKRLRITMLWELRGWPGLTLEQATSEIFGSGSGIEFESDWDLYDSDGKSVLLDDVEISTHRENESLELFDSDKFVNRVSGEWETCTNCGSAREAGAKFCSNCGTTTPMEKIEHKYVSLTWKEWQEQFKPIKNHLVKDPSWTVLRRDGLAKDRPDQMMFETFGVEIDFIISQLAQNKVWTWVDGDHLSSIRSGYHFINRLGHYVCEVPYDEDTEYEINVSTRVVSRSFLKKVWDKLETFASRFSLQELRSRKQVEANEEDEQEEAIEPFALTCVFPNHVEIGFMPATHQHISLCDKCDYPLIPKILMDVLTSGQVPARELGRGEALTSLFSSAMIYWAQYNLDVKNFHVTGQTEINEIYPSPMVTDSGREERQSSLIETLDSLGAYGNNDFGSFDDEYLRMLLGFCSEFLYWDVTKEEASGAREMVLGVRQAFALLNETNFEAFNSFVESIQSTFSHIAPLVAFFEKGLQQTQKSRRIFSPVKVKARFELRARIWQDGSDPINEDDRILVESNPSKFLSARLREIHSNASQGSKTIAALDYQFEGLSTSWEDYWDDDYVCMRYECSLEFHVIIASTAADKGERIEPAELLNTFVAVIESTWHENFFGKPAVQGDGHSIFDYERDEWICGNKFDEVLEDSQEVPAELRNRPVFELEVEHISRNSEWFRGTPWTM